VQIQINGEPREIAEGATLFEVVDSLGMKSDRVAVERNLQIVPRSEWDSLVLTPGDKLEIVHFVGGGWLPWFSPRIS
jgi:thiamine biosynthesis protein ThiS